MSNDKPILVPALTEELLAENEENQKRWANIFVFRNSGVDVYAHQVVSSNLEILQELNKALRRKGADKEALLLRIHALRDETSVWLSSIGDFTKAAEIAYSRANKTLYKDYAAAVGRSDGEWCEHPRWANENGEISQIAYREFDFFSPKHGRKISMQRCNQCGYRNARNLDADLDKLSQHRETVRTASANLSKSQLETNLPAEMKETNLAKILR